MKRMLRVKRIENDGNVYLFCLWKKQHSDFRNTLRCTARSSATKLTDSFFSERQIQCQTMNRQIALEETCKRRIWRDTLMSKKLDRRRNICHQLISVTLAKNFAEINQLQLLAWVHLRKNKNFKKTSRWISDVQNSRKKHGNKTLHQLARRTVTSFTSARNVEKFFPLRIIYWSTRTFTLERDPTSVPLATRISDQRPVWTGTCTTFTTASRTSPATCAVVISPQKRPETSIDARTPARGLTDAKPVASLSSKRRPCTFIGSVIRRSCRIVAICVNELLGGSRS